MILLPLAVAVMGIGLSSCKKYLDASPNATVDPEEAFQNFRNFQGFTEELYNGVPTFTGSTFHNAWNYGEDELWQPDNRLFANLLDAGDYWQWQNAQYHSWFRTGGSVDNGNRDAKGNLYGAAWYCIRKANIGLANLNKLVDATPEEKRLIEGQLYFFRAWYHFMIAQYWGGIPYIDMVLPPDQAPRLPRLTYQQTAVNL